MTTKATTRHRKPRNQKERPPDIWINKQTKGGDHYLLQRGTWYEVELSYLGTPIIGNQIQGAPPDLEKYPPTKWGDGFKGNRPLHFPKNDYQTSCHAYSTLAPLPLTFTYPSPLKRGNTGNEKTRKRSREESDGATEEPMRSTVTREELVEVRRESTRLPVH